MEDLVGTVAFKEEEPGKELVHRWTRAAPGRAAPTKGVLGRLMLRTEHLRLAWLTLQIQDSLGCKGRFCF